MRIRVRPVILLPGCAFEALFGVLILLVSVVVVGIVSLIQQAPIILHSVIGR